MKKLGIEMRPALRSLNKMWMQALFVALVASFGSPQASAAVSSLGADAQAERVKVFAVGPGVTAPELLPLNLPVTYAVKCKKKADIKVVLSVIVDATGRPRNIMFLQPLGADLDKFALLFIAADRFNPGTHDGVPVAVAQSVELTMHACLEEEQDETGKKSDSWRLSSPATQKLLALPHPPEDAVLTDGKSPWQDSAGATHTERVGGSVSAPLPLFTPEAVYTPEARKAQINGKCLISLIVDRQDMPQNLRMLKALGHGLDQNARDAVSRYRFKPAMRDGEPVPVVITVEVNFQLY